MKDSIKSVVVLTAICLVISLGLAATNSVTAPLIEKASAQAAFAACFEVMDGATGFETVTVEGAPATVTEIYKETSGLGYAFKLTTKGYESGLVLMCGIGADGTITGTKVVSSNETPSIGGKVEGDDYKNQYVGKDSALAGVELISGATMTSSAYKSAMLDAFAAHALVSGGTLKYTDEQLAAAALPGAADPVKADLAAEALPDGVSTVFKTANGAGLVFKATSGDAALYIGMNFRGEIAGSATDGTELAVTEETLDTVSAANDTDAALLAAAKAAKAQFGAVYLAAAKAELLAVSDGAETIALAEADATFEPVTAVVPTKYDGDKNITAEVTHVFETETGRVYAVYAHGQYDGMVLFCGIDADGAITGTALYADNETPALSDKVHDAAYAEKYNGLTALDQNIIASGATVSSTAYSCAVRAALAAHAALEGGEEA